MSVHRLPNRHPSLSNNGVSDSQPASGQRGGLKFQDPLSKNGEGFKWGVTPKWVAPGAGRSRRHPPATPLPQTYAFGIDFNFIRAFSRKRILTDRWTTK
ncbi:hypothetical protein EVAR_46558_1 [Eumeta japonica]|uniref:Uncharacterized protein n=1 Tax=Eumeta variegata TaxID=151549 RepID=A0A4C1XR37_EUMVA|nr:hypothetical protein EVAR_46558_1 [Eumeta japonica]